MKVCYFVGWLFFRPRHVWGGLLALGLSWFFISLHQELLVLSYGYALQLLGLFIAARAINSNERLFELPHFGRRIANWWVERTPRTHVLQGEDSKVFATSSMIAFSRRPRSPDANTTQDLNDLWANFDHLDTELREFNKDFARTTAELRALISQEKGERISHATKIEETLRKIAVSSPLTAYFGIYLAILGSALTTFVNYLVQKV